MYKIDPRRLHGIDINASFGEPSVFPTEEGVAIVGRIPSENIINTREVLQNGSLGDIMKGPSYQK